MMFLKDDSVEFKRSWLTQFIYVFAKNAQTLVAIKVQENLNF